MITYALDEYGKAIDGGTTDELAAMFEQARLSSPAPSTPDVSANEIDYEALQSRQMRLLERLCRWFEIFNCRLWSRQNRPIWAAAPLSALLRTLLEKATHH